MGAKQLDPHTFRTLLLLLYGAGLRFSEATGLLRDDVDLKASVLTIRDAKFQKNRLVPAGLPLATVLANHLSQPPGQRFAPGWYRIPAVEQGRDPAGKQHRSDCVRPASAPCGYPRQRWRSIGAAHARSPAQLCSSQAVRMVSGRRRCAAVVARAVHLSRPFRSRRHQSLPDDDPGSLEPSVDAFCALCPWRRGCGSMNF